MGVQTPDDNQGRFDQDVVITNGHLVLNRSFKFNMVTDLMEPYAITIKVMGEYPFILSTYTCQLRHEETPPRCFLGRI